MAYRPLQIVLWLGLWCFSSAKADLLPVLCHVQEHSLDRWLVSYEQLESPLPDPRTNVASSESALYLGTDRPGLLHPRRAVVLHPDPFAESIPLLRSTLRLPFPQWEGQIVTPAVAHLGGKAFDGTLRFAWTSGGLFYPSAFCVPGHTTVLASSMQNTISAPEPYSVLLLAVGAAFCRKRWQGV